jgi:predicted DNA-binding protein (UPF0251 family)
MEYICRQCGTSFKSYNPSPKYCSRSCKDASQTTDVDIERLRVLYIGGKSQNEIAAAFGVTQKVIHNAMKRSGVKARRAIKRNQLGDNNHMWKGEDASNIAFHRRLYSRYGKPVICGSCGTTSAKQYDYANLTGRYEDIEDYLPMCRSCHSKFDNKIQNIKHMRDKIDGRKNNVSE